MGSPTADSSDLRKSLRETSPKKNLRPNAKRFRATFITNKKKPSAAHEQNSNSDRKRKLIVESDDWGINASKAVSANGISLPPPGGNNKHLSDRCTPSLKSQWIHYDSAMQRTCPRNLNLSRDLGDTSITKEREQVEGKVAKTVAETCYKYMQEKDPNIESSTNSVLPTKNVSEELATCPQSTASSLQKAKKLKAGETLLSQECPTSQVHAHQGQASNFKMAGICTFKIKKQINKKSCKRILNFNKKQHEELQNFHKSCNEEKAQLEKAYRVELAFVRSVYHHNPMRADKLKKLDDMHSEKLDKHKSKVAVCINNLRAMQLASRKKEEELIARCLRSTKSWEETRLKGKLPFRRPVQNQDFVRDSTPAGMIENILAEGIVGRQDNGGDGSISDDAASLMLSSKKSSLVQPEDDPADVGPPPSDEASHDECSHVAKSTGALKDDALVVGNNSSLLQIEVPHSHVVVLSDKLKPEALSTEPVDSFHMPLLVDPPHAIEMWDTSAAEIPEHSFDASPLNQCVDEAPMAELALPSHLSSSTNLLPTSEPQNSPVLEDAPSEPTTEPADLSRTVDLPSVNEVLDTSAAEISIIHSVNASPFNHTDNEAQVVELPVQSLPSPSTQVPSASKLPNIPAIEVPLSYTDNAQVPPSLSTDPHSAQHQPQLLLTHENHQPSFEWPTSAASHSNPVQTELGRIHAAITSPHANEMQNNLAVEVLPSHTDNIISVDQSNFEAPLLQPVVQVLPLLSTDLHSAQDQPPYSRLAHENYQPSHGWSAPPAAPQMHMPSEPNPLQSELDRIHIVMEQTSKMHANTKLYLASEFEKEKAHINKKYEVKLQEAEAAFLLKKKMVDDYVHKVETNILLAKALRDKCMDFRGFGPPLMQQVCQQQQQQEEEHLVRLFSQVSSGRPPTVRGLSFSFLPLASPQATCSRSVPPATHPSLVPQSSGFPLLLSPSRPSSSTSPSLLSQQAARQPVTAFRRSFPATPPLQRVRDSSDLFTYVPTRSPNTSFSPVLNIQSLSRTHTPPPHLCCTNLSLPMSTAPLLPQWMSSLQACANFGASNGWKV